MNQGNTKQPGGIRFTAWANVFMNTWNTEFVRNSYEKQALGFITNIDGKIELQHPEVGSTIRKFVRTENADPNSPETLRRAREQYLADPTVGFKYMQPHFGYVVKWLAEIGKRAELEALLTYADTHFSPTWEKGGLYYPRQDRVTNEAGEWTFVDPFTGNAAIGYARLNVEDGQKKMWDKPWTRELLASRPWVDGLDFSQGVDCLRGMWVEDELAMLITLWSWDDIEHRLDFSIKGLPVAPASVWGFYENGNLTGERQILGDGSVDVSITIGPGEEIDIVVIRLE